MRYTHDNQHLGLDLTQVQADAQMMQRTYTKAEYEGLRTLSFHAARAKNGMPQT